MKKKLSLALVTGSLCLCAMTAPAMAAECGVIEGTTPIFEGAATAAEDITIYNDKIAVSFAVGTNNYWNMTRGSILDIGLRGAGGNEYGYDMTNDAEFLVDLWTATGTYNGENLLTDVDCSYSVNDAKDTVTVTMKTRFWSADADKNGVNDDTQFGSLQKPLNVTTTYTLRDGDYYVTMETKVENPADNKVTYTKMYSGYSISTLAQSMFGPFGFYPDIKTTYAAIGMDERVQEPFGEFVVTYSKEYAVSVQLDDADAYKGSSGYKDVYKLRDIAPGTSETYVGELLVSGESETASIMERYIERENISDSAVLSGTVTDTSGKPVEGAYVIVKKMGSYYETADSAAYTGSANAPANTLVTNMQPLVWDITDENGEYSFTLPKTGWDDGTENIAGHADYTYQVKVEAAGYTSVETDLLTLDADMTQDLKVEQGARVQMKAVNQDGEPIPFKVVITGMTSEMKTLGGSVFFSDALASDRYGLDFNMSQAEDITFVATYGGGFTSEPVEFTTDVTADGIVHTFVIETEIDPKAEGWYAMDNHNHSDYGDGATSIEDLYSIQIAEQLDFNVVTDHDARVHNQEMADMAAKDGRIFISGDEISPGWGHWNILNIPYGSSEEMKKSPIDPSVATPQDIIAMGHGFDNAIVNLNHPYSDYGFLRNQESVNGGTAEGWDGFDLLELQSTLDLTGMEALTAEEWAGIDRQHLNRTIPAAYANQDTRTLISAMAFWNEGIPKYLNAGSDAHDAHSTSLYSGLIRLYVQLDDYDLDTYLAALLDGKSYVTMGPILFPAEDAMFGSTISAEAGDELTLTLDVQAVNGMDKVYLWRNGICVDTKELNATTDRTTLTFKTTVPAGEHVWYSYTAVDSNGKWAASNPIWVDVKGYPDVQAGAWYYDAVMDVTDKGLMNGAGGGKFAPNTNLTRGMAVTVLYRMSGETTGVAEEATDAFSDVSASQWYAEAVDWASDNGIVKGSNGKFNPNTNITRQDIATMMYRYAQYKQADTTQSADLGKYTDAGQISDYALDSMEWAVAEGIISGRTQTTLVPRANLTRAEFATIISRYLA